MNAAVKQRAPAALWVLVLGMLFYRMAFVLAHDYSLFVDEAQYWLWSRTPDFGYYSKPPLIAWLIAITTKLLGDTEFAVKLPALLAYPLAALFIYKAGAALRDVRTGLVSAALFLTMPGQALGGWVMSPDSVLLLTWAAALYCLWKAVHTPDTLRYWIGLGVAIGVGALAKYTMLVFVPMAAWVLIRSHRDTLRSRGPWIALALALLILSPNLAWNVAHQFETVKHTAELSNKSGAGLHLGKFGGFLGAQWGIFGLVSFPLLLWRIYAGRSAEERFLKPFTLPYLAIMFGLALVTSANANWAVTAYVGGSLLVGCWLAALPKREVLALALTLNVLLMLGILHYRDVAKWLGKPMPNQGRDVYARVIGWRELGAAVSQRVQSDGALPILSNDRTLLAQMAFYVKPSPYPVDALDDDGHINNQYEMTTRERGLPKDAYWMVFNAGQNGDEPIRSGTEIASYAPLHAAGYVPVEDLGVIRVRRMDGPPRSVHMIRVTRNAETVTP